ncbi:MAG: hypothetical protein KatS3mg010_1892 [Acidimicrobiia bacterium]|nr:MAG: hypothetical protein KatS3mg010_1892 [Acidimicrobiia bacterium]
MLATAAALAVLMHAYGAYLLTLPWNPYLPVLWWVVFLLAVWSITLDDLAMLPVAVFAGSFAMQTHIPYLGLVGGVGACTVAWLAWRARRVRAEPAFGRALVRYGLGAVVLFAVVWAPPVVDEIVHEPGNITTIREHFGDPPEEPVGLATGVESLLTQMNPWRLVSQTLVDDARARPVSGSPWPGALLLAGFAVSAATAIGLRHRRLVALHAVLGVAIALGVVSAARIFGFVWYYLLLWAWGLAALVLLAIGWTVVASARRRREDLAAIGPAPRRRRRRVRRRARRVRRRARARRRGHRRAGARRSTRRSGVSSTRRPPPSSAWRKAGGRARCSSRGCPTRSRSAARGSAC